MHNLDREPVNEFRHLLNNRPVKLSLSWNVMEGDMLLVKTFQLVQIRLERKQVDLERFGIKPVNLVYNLGFCSCPPEGRNNEKYRNSCPVYLILFRDL